MHNIGERDTVSDIQPNVGRIGVAEVVLGVPTYNNRDTIAHAAEASLRAFGDHLSGHRVAIINADGGSQDGTPEHLREMVGDRMPLLQVRYPVYQVDRFATPLTGVPGGKQAALTIFQLARQLGAHVCALLDVEVQSITPEWIDRLTRPVLEGAADLVVPAYLRRKLDGLINSGILSPFTRALFGKRLRQPSGADFGFSAPLMDLYLEQAALNTQAPWLVDPWSTIPAVVHGFQVGQVFLGRRVAGPRDASLGLSGTLQQVLTDVFEQMEHTAAYWQKVRGSEGAPWFGPPLEMDAEPSPVNRKPMIDSFRQGCRDLVEIWSLILPPATMLELRRMERQPEAEFHFVDEVWARVIYDFALGYHLRVMARDHLLQAITPLYLGWAASFAREEENAGAVEVQQRLERLATAFEAQKRYLISRWRWPDRFNP